METKTKVIGIGSLGAVLATLIVIGLNQGLPFYYCESSNILMHCDSIEKYVIDNGKCVNKDLGNKVCSGNGWLLVIEDEITYNMLPDLINKRNELLNYTYNYDQCISSEKGRYHAEISMGYDSIDNSVEFCTGEKIHFETENEIKIQDINDRISILEGVLQ